jgi:hypothetical protein
MVTIKMLEINYSRTELESETDRQREASSLKDRFHKASFSEY